MSRGRLASLCFAAVSGFALLPGHASAQAPIRVGGEFQVNRVTFNNQYDPSVARHANGDFVVVWTDAIADGGGKGIFALRFDSTGNILGAQFRVNTYTPNAQHRALLASESNGDFVVAWTSNRQAGQPLNFYTIFGQRFTSAGDPVGVEFQVNSSIAFYSRYPKIASDADGDFIVVWQADLADPNSAVFARRFNSSGAALGNEFRVNTFTANKQGNPVVASDADGDFVVAWESAQQDGQGYAIVAKRFNSAGTVLATEFQVNSFTLNNQYVPAIAAETDGDFTVVWQSRDQEGTAGNGLGIFGRRFNSSGVGQGIEFLANTYTLGFQRKPQIGADHGGNFIVTWESTGQDGSDDGTFARRVSGSGFPFGPVFMVNSYTVDNQKQIFTNSPLTNGQGVDFDAAGDFVIAWTTEYQDGNAGAVFAQRFTLPPLAIIDVDGNGLVNAFGDGLLILKYLIGLRDANLVSGNLIGAGCLAPRCEADGVETYIESIRPQLDVDGNGLASAFSDGLLILKYLIGLRDANLVSGNLIAGNCTPPKCTATGVGDYIETLRTVP